MKKVREDKEENYNLLDKLMIRKLNIWYLKALCHKAHNISVGDFIKMMEKELKHVSGYQSEVELDSELKIMEMATRYQN